jgi:hypothetical protein
MDVRGLGERGDGINPSDEGIEIAGHRRDLRKYGDRGRTARGAPMPQF